PRGRTARDRSRDGGSKPGQRVLRRGPRHGARDARRRLARAWFRHWLVSPWRRRRGPRQGAPRHTIGDVGSPGDRHRLCRRRGAAGELGGGRPQAARRDRVPRSLRPALDTWGRRPGRIGLQSGPGVVLLSGAFRDRLAKHADWTLTGFRNKRIVLNSRCETSRRSLGARGTRMHHRGSKGMTEAATKTTTTWTIDPSHSVVEFAVKHMMFTTAKGRFEDFAGTIVFDEQNVENSRV